MKNDKREKRTMLRIDCYQPGGREGGGGCPRQGERERGREEGGKGKLYLLSIVSWGAVIPSPLPDNVLDSLHVPCMN